MFKLLQKAYAGLLLLPFIFILFQIETLKNFDSAELIWSFKNSFLQSLLSTLLCFFAGFVFSSGYFSLKRKWAQKAFKFIALTPILLPSLFTLLSIMPWLDKIPRGIVSMSVAHMFVYTGFVTLWMIDYIENNLISLAEVCYVQGISKTRFVFKVLFPLIWKDLIFVLGLVFAFCFTSFSIPLILGGGRGTTIEILIFEKIRISGDYSTATALTFIQTLFLASLALVLSRSKKLEIKNEYVGNSRILSSTLGFVLFCIFSLVYFGGYFFQILSSLDVIDFDLFTTPVMASIYLNTLALGVGSSIFALVFLSIYTFLFQKNWFFKFNEVYLTPSVSIVGLLFLFVWPTSGEASYLRLIMAQIFIFLPSMIKIYLHPQLLGIHPQEQIAELSGASYGQIWYKIRWPQTLPSLGVIASLVGVWSICDFSISRILMSANSILSLEILTLMSGYRLPLATMLSLVLIAISAGLLFIIQWSLYAASKKIIEQL